MAVIASHGCSSILLRGIKEKRGARLRPSLSTEANPATLGLAAVLLGVGPARMFRASRVWTSTRRASVSRMPDSRSPTSPVRSTVPRNPARWSERRQAVRPFQVRSSPLRPATASRRPHHHRRGFRVRQVRQVRHRSGRQRWTFPGSRRSPFRCWVLPHRPRPASRHRRNSHRASQ